MATASPTPLPSYGGAGRASRQTSMRPLQIRRDSPLSVLAVSQGSSANAHLMQNINIEDSSDDEMMPPPPALSGFAQSIINEQRPSAPLSESPVNQTRTTKPKLRISRQNSPSGTPEHSHITPGYSVRNLKKFTVRGAPVRRGLRRTPQGDELDQAPNSQEHEGGQDGSALRPTSSSSSSGGRGQYRDQYAVHGQGNHPPDSILRSTVAHRDQENMAPGSVMKVTAVDQGEEDLQASMMKPMPLHTKTSAQREERQIPLGPISTNTPHRPAPPPPPKMSVLETATAAAGASTTKVKKRRGYISVNGKTYSQMGKIGKGGSSDVYRVMAENGKMFALKRVKLEDADESAVRGYKGEIELLKKLEGVERVVRLFDYEVDESKQVLSVLMDMGESDLSRILRMKLDAENARLDLSFTRYYWKEMLECVQAVHDYDIVHSDLKPANFLLVQGRLKLIDFGIANAIDTDNTVNVHRDSHVGTPNYMSPESLQDTNAGQRGPGGPLGKMMKLGKPSDVWSLGCILYQMVYGRPPFAHIQSQIHRVMAIVNPAVHIEYPPYGVGGVKVPPGLKKTLRGCLNREPSKRPTIPQMLSEHDEFLYPDSCEDLRIPQELLGQIIQRVADRFRDERKDPPTDEEIRQYPASFYAKIRDLLEDGSP